MKKQTIGTEIGAHVRRKANKFSKVNRAPLMKRGMETMRWIDVRDCERFLTGHMTVLRFAQIAGLGKHEVDIHWDTRPVLEAIQEAYYNLFKRAQARWVPDLVAMREWKGKRAITRTIFLLVCLDQLLVPGGLQDWLDRRRSDLDGESPVGLIERGEWTVLADLVDDMLTGAPC